MTEFVGEDGLRWRYYPERKLGQPGPFAMVYAGIGPSGEAIAVKVIGAVRRDGGQLDPSLQKRELEIARQLREHQTGHLIPIMDVGCKGDDVLVVMARADRSLASRASGPMPWLEALVVLKDVAEGLRELHELGIIHRDLKPANVLLHEGQWKLADFGIGRDTRVGTQSPTFVGWGTWEYMAPELFLPKSPTVKTDLYALGCMAYELVAGRLPFPGPDPDSLRRQHSSDPPPQLAGTIDDSLARLVLRLLAKDASKRPQDARDVAEHLARVGEQSGTPGEHDLARDARRFTERQALIEARARAGEADREARHDRYRQAASDLGEICARALTSIRRQFPEVMLTEAAGHGWQASRANSNDVRRPVRGWESLLYSFDGSEAMLEFHVWPLHQYPVVAAGVIGGRNRNFGHRGGPGGQQPDLPPLANIIAELVGDRIDWWMCQFRRDRGARSGKRSETCYLCAGSGQARLEARSIFGQVVNIGTCPNCNGTGGPGLWRVGPFHGQPYVEFEQVVHSYKSLNTKQRPLTPGMLVGIYGEALSLPPF